MGLFQPQACKLLPILIVMQATKVVIQIIEGGSKVVHVAATSSNAQAADHIARIALAGGSSSVWPLYGVSSRFVFDFGA